MIKKRKVVVLGVMFVVLFVVAVQYLMSSLTRSESEVASFVDSTYEQRILEQLEVLPDFYRRRPVGGDNATDTFLRNLRYVESFKNVSLVWKEANDGVSKGRLFLLSSSNVGRAVNALKVGKIEKADLDTRGTQLKFLLTLEGGQTVVFKPKWYNETRIIEGPVYAGKDRYNAEILAFYLSAIIGKPLAPISVRRRIHLRDELLPVASARVLETTFKRRNSTCVFGLCYYCKKEDPICDVDDHLTGAVIFNVGAVLKTYRSPWQRTYKQSKKATWEIRGDYCRTLRNKISKQRLYDLVDTAIFDFLLQNGDRHHYETIDDAIVWIDNGKGLGNPNVHHIDILAPLYQCCILRSDTWNRLQSLSGGLLVENLKKVPDVTEIVTENHLKAIENRLLMVYATVEFCRNRNKIKHSLF